MLVDSRIGGIMVQGVGSSLWGRARVFARARGGGVGLHGGGRLRGFEME
jgi:hypothetical protein